VISSIKVENYLMILRESFLKIILKKKKPILREFQDAAAKTFIIPDFSESNVII
jgi:hypothetical protein